MFVYTSVYMFSTFVCLYMCAFMCALCMHVRVFIVNSIVSSMSSRPSGLYLLDTNSSSYLTPGCDIKKINVRQGCLMSLGRSGLQFHPQLRISVIAEVQM